MTGTTGFVESQHWIQNGKFRDNVCFGSEFEERKYVETVLACQFQTDLSLMPAGDLTEIGEKGINLSGGQKARISLARAVYKQPDIVIMDDPISALDTQTRKKIFDQVFQGILKDKTRILVTHAVDFVNLADKIVIMKEGKIIAQGSPIELWAHPYLLEIQEIHDKNKQEIEAMNMEQDELIRKVSGSGLTLSDIESDPEDNKKPEEKTFGLTDEEIRAKLRKFSGADRGLDKQTEQVVGKLLLDEADEKVDADQETWSKLHGMIGGSTTILVLGVTVTSFKYFEIYKQGVQQEWSDATPEE